MKGFCEAYADSPKLAPLVREIGWSHNIIIMERCKDLLEREFYIRMTRKFGWTKNVLIHQIENQSYEKTLLGQTNFDLLKMGEDFNTVAATLTATINKNLEELRV
jgi:predicted nuclease of restriction endonuclease-like (RecB) superfamily